jgi:Domain of Unknown Function with PDB structure (DUF3857)/Transglutaminase-like superfamily
MKNIASLLLSTALFAAQSIQTIYAQPKAQELQHRIERYHVNYRINTDGTHTEIRETATKVLDKRAIEFLKYGSVSWSTSVEKGEVLDAYTLKPDGRNIAVPKNNYQIDISKGQGAESPIYSDRTSLSLVYPEVELNDTLVLRYSITASQAIFPGHFSSSELFPAQTAYDDVKVTFDVPAGMKFQFHTTDMTQHLLPSNADRVITQFHYKNVAPQQNQRRNQSVFEIDDSIGVRASTFNHYGEIAKAYGSRASIKAQPTEKVKKLAAEITGDITTPREKIQALYKWVTSNIHYAGNCVGVGAVVPRDLDFVLENRIGDCKDYATLMQSLMSASGIASEQALINAGSSWKLPKVPLVFAVNHVINYVPSLNLFFDATATTMPFGVLAPNISGKPVLLVENYIEGKKTPFSAENESRQSGRVMMKIAQDGSVSGKIEVGLTGMSAIFAKERAKNSTKQWDEEMMKNTFNRDGTGGNGKIERDDPKGAADRYGYTITFDMKEYLTLPGPGAWLISLPSANEASIGGRLYSLQFDATDTAKEVVCIGGSTVEEFEVSFPKNAPLLATPKNLAIVVGNVSYRSLYSRAGNTLKVKRELDDRRVGPVCSAESMLALQPLVRRVRADLKSQVVYR